MNKAPRILTDLSPARQLYRASLGIRIYPPIGRPFLLQLVTSESSLFSPSPFFFLQLIKWITNGHEVSVYTKRWDMNKEQSWIIVYVRTYVRVRYTQSFFACLPYGTHTIYSYVCMYIPKRYSHTMHAYSKQKEKRSNPSFSSSRQGTKERKKERKKERRQYIVYILIPTTTTTL